MTSRKTKQLEKRKAEDEAYTARCERVLADCFSAIPQPYRDQLQCALVYAIVNLFNNCDIREGDTLLKLLPSATARALLDWYFDDAINADQIPKCLLPNEQIEIEFNAPRRPAP